MGVGAVELFEYDINLLNPYRITFAQFLECIS